MLDDVYLGGDAALASGDSYDVYSGQLDDGDSEATQRELGRRLDEGRTPVYPLDARRRLPLPGLWRRWRAFATRRARRDRRWDRCRRGGGPWSGRAG